MSPEPPGPVSYVLPIRAQGTEGLEELTAYLRALAAHAEVIVVDGSDPPVFAAHAAHWAPHVRHMRPHADLGFLSGKVDGVTTGVREASHERVVIADDDVRYDAAALERMRDELGRADLVRPQNHFRPLPWHARWDSARSLLNRGILGADHPGTLGVRRSTFISAGGYDGDVLFENLELVRTIAAAGGRVATPPDLFVRRLPPTTAHFLSQRVRQAYDDFAEPARLATSLAVLPVLALAPRRRRVASAIALAAVALAERGRRRGGATAVFPASASLLAPAWVLERAVCSWLAVAARARRGGVRYGGVVVRRAANRPADIRRRLEAGEPARPRPPRAP